MICQFLLIVVLWCFFLIAHAKFPVGNACVNNALSSDASLGHLAMTSFPFCGASFPLKDRSRSKGRMMPELRLEICEISTTKAATNSRWQRLFFRECDDHLDPTTSRCHTTVILHWVVYPGWLIWGVHPPKSDTWQHHPTERPNWVNSCRGNASPIGSVALWGI